MALLLEPCSYGIRHIANHHELATEPLHEQRRAWQFALAEEHGGEGLGDKEPVGALEPGDADVALPLVF